jgi:hypothetical protein
MLELDFCDVHKGTTLFFVVLVLVRLYKVILPRADGRNKLKLNFGSFKMTAMFQDFTPGRELNRSTAPSVVARVRRYL